MSNKQALVVGAGVVNTLWFEDSFSGARFGVRFMRPTSTQRIRWGSIVHRRNDKGKLDGSIMEANITLGKELICGIEPNCIALEDGTMLSSDKGTPGYREDWYRFAVDSGCLDGAAEAIAQRLFVPAQEVAKTPQEACARALMIMMPHMRLDMDKAAAVLVAMMHPTANEGYAKAMAEVSAPAEPVVTEGN